MLAGVQQTRPQAIATNDTPQRQSQVVRRRPAALPQCLTYQFPCVRGKRRARDLAGLSADAAT